MADVSSNPFQRRLNEISRLWKVEMKRRVRKEIMRRRERIRRRQCTRVRHVNSRKTTTAMMPTSA